MRRSIIFVLACAAGASADVTVLDQIGDGSALRDGGGFVFGYFNHYSTPPVSFGNRGVLDDFSVSAPTRLTRIEAAVAAAPGSPVNWGNVIGWRVEVYSSPQVALNNDLTGDLLHVQFAAPARFTNPFVPFSYGGNPIVLASFDVDVTVNAGMYWVAVIPVNTSTNGYAVLIGSTIFNSFVPWQVLPGQTVVPLGATGVALRVMAASECYANCDGSTASPVLTVNDFVCFQARFAAGDSYANCDGSTGSPALTVNDFVCFQQRFAAGCS